jgi:hypothetical protein
LYDSLPISQAFGEVKNIITCGNGCYAFNTTDNKVIIIKDSTLGLSEAEQKNNLSIYPNPTSDYLLVKSDLKIEDIQISDMNGRIINNLKFQDNKMNLASLQTGIYFAKISDINGKLKTVKIIKK